MSHHGASKGEKEKKQKEEKAKKRKVQRPKGEEYESDISEEELERELGSKVGFLITPKEEDEKNARKMEFARQEMHKRAKKLKAIFASVFPKDEWDRSVNEKDGSVTYTNKVNSNHKIMVEEEKNDIRFSGTPIEKLIEATAAFEAKLPGMTYEVEAETAEDAIGFMEMLHRNGFDLNKITDIKSMDGKELITKEGKKIGAENLKDIIAQIERTVPRKTSGKGPSPGLSGRKQSEE